MQQRIHTYVACLTLCCGYYPLNLMGITWGLMDQKKWRMAQTCKFHGWDKESMINFWGSLFSGKTRWTSQKNIPFYDAEIQEGAPHPKYQRCWGFHISCKGRDDRVGWGIFQSQIGLQKGPRSHRGVPKGHLCSARSGRNWPWPAHWLPSSMLARSAAAGKC